MRQCLIAVSALALLAACSKPQTSDQTPAAVVVSDQVAAASDTQAQAALPSVAAPKPVAAADFVAMAAAGDMFEIAASRMAVKRSMNPDIVAFAQMMIVDHAKTTARIKKAVAESGEDLSPPKAMPDKQQAMLDALKSAPNDAFDKLYVQQQVDGHKDALDLMAGYSKHGDTPALKAAATEITPLVQMHLDKIKTIQQGLK